MSKMEGRFQVVASSLGKIDNSVANSAVVREQLTVSNVNSVSNSVKNGVNNVPPANVSAPSRTSAAASSPKSNLLPQNTQEEHGVFGLGYIVKPTVFDGKSSWEEYKSSVRDNRTRKRAE